MNIKIWAWIAGVVVVGAIAATLYLFGPDARPLSLDQLQSAITENAREQLGDDESFRVILTQTEFPIGTLVRKGRTLGAGENDTDCIPDKPPNRYSTPSLFPAVTVSRDLTGTLKLDSAMGAIGKLGFRGKTGDGLEMSVEGPMMMALTGDKLSALLAREDCRRALAGRELLIVRGYVLGRRNFVLHSRADVSVDRPVTVASFEISATGNRKVAISDRGEERFLQIVSAVAAPRDLAQAAQVTAPTTAATSSGRVYVQRDAGDASDTGDRVVAALSARFQGSPQIERIVEAIPTNKMPSTPQVRYFNAEDLELAQAASQVLQGQDLRAKVVRISLPAPKGQLEIWLQRRPPISISRPSPVQPRVSVSAQAPPSTAVAAKIVPPPTGAATSAAPAAATPAPRAPKTFVVEIGDENLPNRDGRAALAAAAAGLDGASSLTFTGFDRTSMGREDTKKADAEALARTVRGELLRSIPDRQIPTYIFGVPNPAKIKGLGTEWVVIEVKY